MRQQFFGLLSLFLLLALAGCGDKSETKTPDAALTVPGTEGSVSVGENPGASGDSKNEGSAKTETHDHSHPHEDAEPKEIPARETLNGNWLLAFPQLVPPQQEGQELKAGERTVLLIDIDGADGDSVSASAIAGRQGLEQTGLSEVKVDGNHITFQVNDADGEKAFEFSGQLKMGLVIGHCSFADGNVVMARLLPTAERTFARIPMLIPLPETQMFIQLGNSPVPDEDTRSFVEMIPVSPLGRIAYIRLVNMTAGRNAPAKDLDRVIDEFTTMMKDWGEVAVLFSEFEAFSAASMASYDVDWCLAKADEMEEKLKANKQLEKIAGQVDGLRKQIQYRQTTELLESDNEEDRKKARELAETFLKEAPFEPVLSILMADDARENKRTDEAIRRYAELVALPMQERVLQQLWANEPVQKILPTERLAKLWKEKHGSTKGLDEYLDKVYHDGINSIADAPVAATPQDADKHTVLCELFTGARCAPCVSADVALEAIASTYPQSQVITLRYHVHVPGHDPLTNDDCEARFYNFYKANGTPTLLIDGGRLNGVAGLIVNSPQAYRGLRQVISELRGESPEDNKPGAGAEQTDKEAAKPDDKAATTEEKSEDEDDKVDGEVAENAVPKISIELKASRQQDSIQISASVKGLTAETGNVRLMLALAESDIRYEAFNGIRKHDMVVRQLIGGDRGLSPKDQKLDYQGTVDVEKLRDRLHSYLTEFEENQGVEFASMPLELKNLSIVAFVQNVETRKVIQSVVIPVSGTVTAE